MVEQTDKKPQDNLGTIGKVISGVTGIITTITAFLVTTRDLFLNNPDLPQKLLWLGVVAFMCFGALLASPAWFRKRPQVIPSRRQVAFGIFLLIGAPLAGYAVDHKVFQLTASQRGRLENLKTLAKDQMDEDPKAARNILQKAREITRRDPEVNDMLDKLKPK